MTTRWAGSTIYGDKLYQERARKALPILVRQAARRQPISYTDLARELGMPNPRNLNFVLGSIGETLQALSKKWNEEIPLINFLVVNKATLKPGSGISLFLSGGKALDWRELRNQRATFEAELKKIYAFRKWGEVLDALGLKP